MSIHYPLSSMSLNSFSVPNDWYKMTQTKVKDNSNKRLGWLKAGFRGCSNYILCPQEKISYLSFSSPISSHNSPYSASFPFKIDIVAWYPIPFLI